MGTRINVLVDHHLPDYRVASTVVAALSPTIAAAYAVRDYWDATQTQPYRDRFTEWRVAHDYFEGPGGLFIDFTDHLALIWTGGRWRGFLSIPELHRVHLNAFIAIADSLGGTNMVVYGDNDFVDDNQPLSACVAKLHELWGPPQESINSISPEIVAATDHCPPAAWFIEPVERKAT